MKPQHSSLSQIQVILISLPQQAPGKFKLALSNVQKTTASVHLFSFTGKETKAMN